MAGMLLLDCCRCRETARDWRGRQGWYAVNKRISSVSGERSSKPHVDQGFSFPKSIFTYQQVHSEKASRLKAVIARYRNVICCTSNAGKCYIKVTIRQEWKHGKGDHTKVVRGTANEGTTITIKDRHNSLPFIVRNDHTIHCRFGGSKRIPKYTSIPVDITCNTFELGQGSLVSCCECPRRFVNFDCAFARIVGRSRKRL